MNNLSKYLDILPEIQEALDNNKPVVALESTILTHGLPYPENLDLAAKCEEIIRGAGAIPATTAIIGGKLKVGLTPDELKLMCTDTSIAKASRRDVATLVATGKPGATTVATTMLIAGLAGIKVFATGGIGGVHRHGEVTMDVSADLQELAHTNVAVVGAGCKSILDIGRTLEYLETFGVPVLCMESDNMPAFYVRESGFKGDYALKDEAEAAAILKTKWDLGLQGGVLIANPIPKEDEMDPAYINKIIDDAVAECEAKGIHGKECTPFILAAVHHNTGRASVVANLALVYNNCKVAANVAVELAKLG